MQDNTSTAPAVAIPPSSIPSSAAVATAAYPSSQAQAAPASYPTQQAPSAYQATQAPASGPPAMVSNPWQAAFQQLSNSLSAQPSSPSPAAFWPGIQSAPVMPEAPVSVPAYQGSYMAAPSVTEPQTWRYPQQPAYFPTQAPAQMPMPMRAPLAPAMPEAAPASADDAYLSGISDESLEVLVHFGAETPALLNKYSCVLEDALMNQARQNYENQQIVAQLAEAIEEAKLVIGAAAEDNAAYHTLLTNPSLLSDYVIDFFGPEGPYPVRTPRDALAEEVAMAEAEYAQMPRRSFERPQMDIPAPGAQRRGGGSDFWDVFEQVSNSNPAALYQLLSQASPEDLRSRILISDTVE